jgi:hypothetical protein
MSAYDLLQAFMHQTDMTSSDEYNEYVTPDEGPLTNNEFQDNDTMLVNTAKSSTSLKHPPGDFRRNMSKSSTRYVNQIEYYGSKHHTTNRAVSLADHGVTFINNWSNC